MAVEATIPAPVGDRPWGPPILLYNGPRVFPGGKVAEAWRWPPTLPSAEDKERVELYLYSPYRPSWPVLGCTLQGRTVLQVPFVNYLGRKCYSLMSESMGIHDLLCMLQVCHCKVVVIFRQSGTVFTTTSTSEEWSKFHGVTNFKGCTILPLLALCRHGCKIRDDSAQSTQTHWSYLCNCR